MKKVKMFGKSVPLLAVLVIALVGTIGVFGALLEYYGRISKTITVTQAVLLDGKDYTEPIEVVLEDVVAGTTICQVHNLTNTGPKPAEIDWSYETDVVGEGIEVLVLSSVYEEYDTLGKDVEATITKTWNCSVVTWVVDIISDNVPHGVYGVGLVISLGDEPVFQVWYAEAGVGQGAPAVGWFYQEYPWGENLNIPIEDVPGIVAVGDGAAGEKQFVIEIDCEYFCGAGAEYWWNMQVRTNLISWVGEPYNWGPDTTGFIVNHTGEEIEFPYVLGPGDSLVFNLAFNLDVGLQPGTYHITTEFYPM